MGVLRLTNNERELWRNIAVGDRADIIIQEGGKQRYTTTVTGINDSDVFVKTPEVNGASVEFPEKLPVAVEIEIHAPRLGRLRFSSEIVGQEWLEQHSAKIACPSKITWVPVRWHYRVDVALSAEFSFLEAERAAGDLQLTQSVFSAEVINVSEGGALFVVDTLMPMELGARINVKINLDEQSLLRARGEVMHIELAKKKCGIGVKWVILGDKDLSALRRLVFSRLKSDV